MCMNNEFKNCYKSLPWDGENKDPGCLRSFKDAVSPFPSHTPPEGGEVCASLLGE